MTFEEALDALLREYNKDDWEVTIRTLFKAIDKVADFSPAHAPKENSDV